MRRDDENHEEFVSTNKLTRNRFAVAACELTVASLRPVSEVSETDDDDDDICRVP